MNRLPVDVLTVVVHFLGPRHMLTMCSVSRGWYADFLAERSKLAMVRYPGAEALQRGLLAVSATTEHVHAVGFVGFCATMGALTATHVWPVSFALSGARVWDTVAMDCLTHHLRQPQCRLRELDLDLRHHSRLSHMDAFVDACTVLRSVRLRCGVHNNDLPWLRRLLHASTRVESLDVCCETIYNVAMIPELLVTDLFPTDQSAAMLRHIVLTLPWKYYYHVARLLCSMSRLTELRRLKLNLDHVPFHHPNQRWLPPDDDENETFPRLERLHLSVSHTSAGGNQIGALLGWFGRHARRVRQLVLHAEGNDLSATTWKPIGEGLRTWAALTMPQLKGFVIVIVVSHAALFQLET